MQTRGRKTDLHLPNGKEDPPLSKMQSGSHSALGAVMRHNILICLQTLRRQTFESQATRGSS